MRSSILFFAFAIASVVGLSPSVYAQSPTPPRFANQTAEEKFKNIQVFKGLPATQLDPAMAFISGSLGVKCDYCHVNPFDKDARPTKLTARRMIQMVFDLNKGSFNGQNGISCFTCHRGKPTPVSVPAVGQNLWQSNPKPGAATDQTDALPTVDQILDKYAQAAGGPLAFQRITSRIAKASRIGADGVLVPEEIYQKAPNKLLVTTSYPKVVFTSGFNGTLGWGHSSQGPVELPDEVLAQLKSDSEFYKEIKLRELYAQLNLVGKTAIGDGEAYMIAATTAVGKSEKLFFDVHTGLLVRRYVESQTVLGRFPLQTDYEDYREVDGIKQPFLIHWSMPGRIWGRKISEIKQNVDIDDVRFNPPPSNR